MAAVAWNDPQSQEQAILVAEMQAEKISWDELDDWVRSENIVADKAVEDFYRAVKRELP